MEKQYLINETINHEGHAKMVDEISKSFIMKTELRKTSPFEGMMKGQLRKSVEREMMTPLIKTKKHN